MNIERYIAVYDKDDDSLLEDIRIHLSPQTIIDVLGIDKGNDPDVHKAYTVNESQLEKLKSLLPELRPFDLREVFIKLECFSIE